MDIEIEVSEFKYYLRSELGESNNTVISYAKDIENYLTYLINYEDIEDVNEIKTNHIQAFLAFLKKHDYSTTSINRSLSSIKNYHKYLLKEFRVKTNVALLVDPPKMKKQLPTVLTVEEIIALLNSVDCETVIGRRNQLMFELDYACGLRVSELLSLKLADLHLTNKMIRVEGKGNKERLIPIHDIAIEKIKNYLIYDRPKLIKDKKDPQTLFVNSNGEMMSRQAYFKIIKTQAKLAGIEKTISPHTIRHSYATHLLENNVDLRLIQELLGHEDISTTQIYTHISKQKMMSVYNEAHPRQNKKENNDEN